MESIRRTGTHEESELKRQLSAKAKEITTELRLGNHFNRSHLERLLERSDIESWELDEAEILPLQGDGSTGYGNG